MRVAATVRGGWRLAWSVPRAGRADCCRGRGLWAPGGDKIWSGAPAARGEPSLYKE